MKKIFFSALLFLSIAAAAQETPMTTPAAKGVNYGKAVDDKGEIFQPDDVEPKMVSGKFSGKVSGKVIEVCQSMGCWITLAKEDGTTLMVKSEDHAFFMPQDLKNHFVVVEGSGKLVNMTESKRKHMAEDAGKTKEEIDAIKGDKREVHFIASGIRVL